MSGSAHVSEAVRAERIASESGQRLLAAARRTIARDGVVGSTLDAVTTEAGLARGMVFWVFGSKDRLLIELLEADARERIQGLHDALSAPGSFDELLEAVIGQVESFIDEDLGAHVLLQEMASVALREPAIRSALAARRARWRSTLAEVLEDKRSHGIIAFDGEPAVVATTLTALGHGLATQAALEPGYDLEPAVEEMRRWVRALFAPGRVADSGARGARSGES